MTTRLFILLIFCGSLLLCSWIACDLNSSNMDRDADLLLSRGAHGYQVDEPGARGKPLIIVLSTLCAWCAPFAYHAWKALIVLSMAAGMAAAAALVLKRSGSCLASVAAPLALIIVPAIYHVTLIQDDNALALLPLVGLAWAVICSRERPWLLGLCAGVLAAIHLEHASVIVAAWLLGGMRREVIYVAVAVFLGVDLIAWAMWPQTAPAYVVLAVWAVGMGVEGNQFPVTALGYAAGAWRWLGLGWAVVALAALRPRLDWRMLLLAGSALIWPLMYEARCSERWFAAGTLIVVAVLLPSPLLARSNKALRS